MTHNNSGGGASDLGLYDFQTIEFHGTMRNSLRNRSTFVLILAALFTAVLPARSMGADSIPVTFDFGHYRIQLDGCDGGSVCQFHGSDPKLGTVSSERTYATLRGFPDDNSATEFGQFCDVAFSTHGTNGMGLSQIWSTPCPLQTPAGAIGNQYEPEHMLRLDFSMYEPGVLDRARFLNEGSAPVRGHTTPLLKASLRRARAEGKRVLYWTDLHTDFPIWMWTDGLRKKPVREELWEEAALHIVYYVKYLTAVQGIPVHTVSFQNEPDLPSRHSFTPEMLIRISKVLREKLDEAGLNGVRIMPFTSFVLNTTYVPWLEKTVSTLDETYRLLEDQLADYQPFIDTLGGHLSHSEAPISRRLRNTHFWRASGDFDSHWQGNEKVTFDMGPDDQVDEVIRMNMWLYGQGVNQVGIWQVALRMGHTVDDFVLPETFDIDKSFRRQAIAGAATVYPYVRPGMFLVGGSMGARYDAPYSVDGFAGRGQPEVVVITNSGGERTFDLHFIGQPKTVRFEVYQCTAEGIKRRLEDQHMVSDQLEIQVPADSVTTLVATMSHTQPRIYFVVSNPHQIAEKDRQIIKVLAEGSFDVVAVSGCLSLAEQDRYDGKRHPIDPMGAAIYVLSDSLNDPSVVNAYRTVMAPVIALGEKQGRVLGVSPGRSVWGGELLDFRNDLDPPASMLPAGRPLACGPRASFVPGGNLSAVLDLLRRMMKGQQ